MMLPLYICYVRKHYNNISARYLKWDRLIPCRISHPYRMCDGLFAQFIQVYVSIYTICLHRTCSILNGLIKNRFKFQMKSYWNCDFIQIDFHYFMMEKL